MLSAAAAADEDFLYGSSPPGTDTDGMASMAQGAAARVWASGYQDQDQVGRPSHFYHLHCGAACYSLGFEDDDLGSSPGWWVASVATYCPSRPGELPKLLSSKPFE